jgi:hypothetical protein
LTAVFYSRGALADPASNLLEADKAGDQACVVVDGDDVRRLAEAGTLVRRYSRPVSVDPLLEPDPLEPTPRGESCKTVADCKKAWCEGNTALHPSCKNKHCWYTEENCSQIINPDTGQRDYKCSDGACVKP